MIFAAELNLLGKLLSGKVGDREALLGRVALGEGRRDGPNVSAR